MKITFELAGVLASIEDTDEEYNSIHQAFEICLNVLKAVGFQDETIKTGIKKLNQELNN